MILEKIKTFGFCIRQSVYDLMDHGGVEHAGYLAFLLMLTIFPFLVFFMAIVGFVGDAKLANILVQLILDSHWASFIDALKPRIIEITSSPPQSLLTLALLSAMWTASSLFEALRAILNKAHRVTNPPSYILRRLFSILECTSVILVITLLLALLIFIPLAWKIIYEFLNIQDSLVVNFISPAATHFRYILLLSIGFLFVAGLYCFIPNKKQRLIDTFPGTLVVLVGWSCASSLFRLYLNTFPSINIIYGSIAGVIIALLYFYICSLIFILGAELNYRIAITNASLDKKES